MLSLIVSSVLACSRPLVSKSIDLGPNKAMTVFTPKAELDAENEAVAAILGLSLEAVTAQRGELLQFEDADGQKIWPASIAFARYLSGTGPSPVKDCNVIELGCGLGVVGIAAALGGASSVLLTDLKEENLALAEAAAEANGVSHLVSTRVLDWTQPGDLSSLGPFDVVLGSDVLYSCNLSADLVQIIATLLLEQPRVPQRPEPRAILVDPPKRPSRAILPELCSSCGLYWGGEMPLPAGMAEEPDTVMINLLRG